MKQRLVLSCLLGASIALCTPNVPTFADPKSTQDVTPKMLFDTPFPGYPIHLNSHGTVVKEIQQQLNADGYVVGGDDGIFGPLTLRGVKEFQTTHNFKPSGIVGQQTWEGLFRARSTVFFTRIERYVSARRSHVSVAVYNANNGETDVYNPNVTFATASIIKPLILATLLHNSEIHQTLLSTWAKQLAIPMIEQSDNGDATDLWNLAGSATGVQSFTHAANMNDTIPNPLGYWGLTTTSALDQVTLVKDLAFTNRLLNSSDRNYELNLMHSVIGWQRWGISGGVPEKDYVALKNGWLPLQSGNWEINSIGYVKGDGRNYVIAVLTSNNPSEQYGISTVEGISHIVWATQGASKSGVSS